VRVKVIFFLFWFLSWEVFSSSESFWTYPWNSLYSRWHALLIYLP